MKLIKRVLLGALVSIPLMGFAQDEPDVKWKSSLAVGATYKSGNTEKNLFTANLKGDRYSKESDWLNSLYGEHGKTDGLQSEGQLRGQSDYRHKFGDNKDFFGGVFGEIFYDDIKKIRTQAKLGPNIGYYFINEDTMKLDAGVGINYVYRRTATTEENFGEYRAFANYLWDFSEDASYYLNLEYSANVEDTDDGTGLLVTGLKDKVSKQLSLFVELRAEYDNMPSVLEELPTIDRADYTDVTVLAGLNYDF